MISPAPTPRRTACTTRSLTNARPRGATGPAGAGAGARRERRTAKVTATTSRAPAAAAAARAVPCSAPRPIRNQTAPKTAPISGPRGARPVRELGSMGASSGTGLGAHSKAQVCAAIPQKMTSGRFR
ncbi:hypothetical protein D1J60_34750 (plasmid) [Streptomyces sp. W1SF4]|nr:hypothetical protein D1J60_34750 [Streptomyces sp. W1SF4]